MKIVIGADFVPTKSNEELFCAAKIGNLIGSELLNVLNEANYRIFNLEVPLVDKETPIDKCGPNLIAPVATVNGYKAVGTDLVTLANNHIMDQGLEGLRSTIQTLDDLHIAHVGAGESIETASKPFFVDLGNKKIGVYACAEHEFSIASEQMAGANPIDLLESFDQVAETKGNCDFLIVLYHGGKEHYRYPSPELQRICRKFITKGADLVVCQHSHCVGCEEKYENGTIVYGQGNFLFDGSQSEYWKTSLLVQIDENCSISYIPIVKNEIGVELAGEEKAKEILDGFFKRSTQIREEGFLQSTYKAFAEEAVDNYFCAIAGKGPKNYMFRLLNKITNYKWQHLCWKYRYKKVQRVKIINFIECEAHRELFLAGLKKI